MNGYLGFLLTEPSSKEPRIFSHPKQGWDFASIGKILPFCGVLIQSFGAQGSKYNHKC